MKTDSLKPTAVRIARSVRNVFRDPPPRKHILELNRIDVDGAQIDFVYRAKGREYRVSLTLPARLSDPLKSAHGEPLQQLLTAIGLAFAPLLFKLTDFAEVAVNTAPLDLESISFFEAFFVGGLGEFRYLQGLDPARKIRVTAPTGAAITPLRQNTEDRLLMLNGGGKDTIVAAELLKAGGQPFTWVTVRPNATRRKVIELSGVPDSIEVKYESDETIVNDRAYHWGHVPNTSIVLSIGLLIAVLTKARYVAAGNEISADYGNVVYRGFEVNHQYTKSSAFERGFWRFAQRRVTSSTSVFSVLRPFYDLQLAQLFSTHRQYLGDFISCNAGIGRGQWCKRCPKCAFTALALRPFLPPGEHDAIFGEDVIQRVKIRKHILDLVRGDIKPWECVGTRDECALALQLTLEKYPGLDFDSFPRRRDFEKALLGFDTAKLRSKVLETTANGHMIPEVLVERLNRALSKTTGTEFIIRSSTALPASLSSNQAGIAHHEPDKRAAALT
jgi:hypothetical protein